jgi:hypothetical protein
MALEIKLIEHREPFTAEDLKVAHGTGDIIACDFYVSGAEDATWVPGGYEFDGLLNVDHHAPGKRMARHVSSTNLALRSMRRMGAPPKNSIVVISHTDCDSILSSGIMSGHLDPDPVFAAAAIAADHTGETNEIADLLQGLDDIPKDRRPRVPMYFINTVQRYVEDGMKSLDSLATEGLSRRLQMREAASDVVQNGDVKVTKGLAEVYLASRIDGELFIPLLPDAVAILFMCPRLDDSSRWDAKLRLGAAAPRGSSLHDLNINEFDPAFGGRWNAGSNTRNGGTSMDTRTYASNVRQRLRSAYVDGEGHESNKAVLL